MNPLNKIVKARAQLILESPFFGNLSLRLNLVEAPDIETMAVDPETLYFNAEFVTDLPMPELKGVVVHEILHISLGHCWRRSGRDPRKWNEACDYAINPLVLEAGHQLPKGRLLDPAYAGMAAEEIYKLLPTPKQDTQQGGTLPDGRKVPQDLSGCGSVAEAPQGTNERETERKWKQATAQAAQMARAAGKLGGGLEEAVAEALAAKAPWELLLKEFMVQTARSDYSWEAPNRRHVHRGLYLPSLRSEETSPLALAIDTSGSISKEDLRQISSELNCILEEIKPKVLHLICADTKVNSHKELTEEDYPVELKVKGRGGTRLQPALDFVEQLEEPPAALIYLTDLISRDVGNLNDPGIPILWMNTRPSKLQKLPTFGEVVEL